MSSIAPDFPDGCSQAEVDRRYAPFFRDCSAQLWGDATPIYCFTAALSSASPPTIGRCDGSCCCGIRWNVQFRTTRWSAGAAMNTGRSGLRCCWSAGDLLDTPATFRRARRCATTAIGRAAIMRGSSMRSTVIFPAIRCWCCAARPWRSGPRRPCSRSGTSWGFAALEPRAAYGRVFEGGYVAKPRSSLQFRLMRWLMAAQMRRARRCHEIDWL